MPSKNTSSSRRVGNTPPVDIPPPPVNEYKGSLNPAALQKFIAPMEQQPYAATTLMFGGGSTTGLGGGGAGTTTAPLPPATAPTKGASFSGNPFFRPGPGSKIALDQVPPIERAELPRFQTVARGTGNPLAHQGTPEEEAAAAPRSQPIKCSLEKVWLKGQFAKAPQVQDIDTAILKANKDPKQAKSTQILRYVPERFERGCVRRPQISVEEVDTELVFGDDNADELKDGKIQNPKLRRWAHDTAINARQGSQALKEALMQKNKMIKTFRFNNPHGAMGVAESPYDTNSTESNNLSATIFESGSRLERESKLAARKGKGGKTPAGSMGGLLKGEDPSSSSTSNGAMESSMMKKSGKKIWAPSSSFNLASMVGDPHSSKK